jgi:preprotein translocase subunit SecD
MRRKRSDLLLLLSVVGLFALALTAILPPESTRLGRTGFRLGLDLKGGTHLVYEADLTKRDPAQSEEDAMEGVLQKIRRRVDAYGVTEPIIQKQGKNRVLVQLPGVKNIDEAIQLIGQTAQLDYREMRQDEEGNIQWVPATATGSDGEEKALTGKYFKPNAHVTFDQLNRPQVAFELDSEGAILFEQITERNLGQPLGIFLDDQLISAPTVEAVIKNRGVITGLTLERAKLLAIQLNSGVLDVPLTIIQQQNVDPTLGKDSLQKSLVAGFIGIALLFLFMVLYYRLPGALACLALLVYGSLVLAVFKMVPVTLTLAGIAAFILSLGMAVDANVLIFERIKEELRGGRTMGSAIEAGFERAWSAIRDSNFTTFIACAVLYWFGSRFGAPQVMGFALTLAIGVAVSMFSAILVTRTFLRSAQYLPGAKRLWRFRVEG